MSTPQIARSRQQVSRRCFAPLVVAPTQQRLYSVIIQLVTRRSAILNMCLRSSGQRRNGIISFISFIADKVTTLITKAPFVAGHFLWLAVWGVLNMGIISYIKVFDDPPCFLLVTILAIETIFISISVQMSNNRQSAHAETRADLDYEVNVLAYRASTRMHAIMQQMQDRLEQTTNQNSAR
jgi:uncharacterized membrane protein